MKDVCAEVLEHDTVGYFHIIKVWWINLLGTVDRPRPFHITSGRRAAIETIKITVKEFNKEWQEYDDIRSLEISAKATRNKTVSNS